MDRVGSAKWGNYKKLMKDAHDTFNQAEVIWRRYTSFSVNQDFNEDKSEQYSDVLLKVLFGYNFFRTWPITKHSTSGELDNQNMIMLINREYLNDRGFLADSGYFNFDPSNDRFIYQGIIYKSEGDTALSQAPSDPLHIQLVLKREEIKVGQQFNAQQ